MICLFYSNLFISHPQLILESYKQKLANKEPIDEDLLKLIKTVEQETNINVTNNLSLNNPTKNSMNNTMKNNNKLNNNHNSAAINYIKPELSGKLMVLHRMMLMIQLMKIGDRIVIVSNYTSTLDLIEQMCW